MDLDGLIARMESFPTALAASIEGIAKEDLRWQPHETAWSLLDILDHLYLEELQDFRPRLASLRENPSRPWESLDPESAVVQRRKEPHEAADTLAAFRKEREDSVQWLRSLDDVDWEASYDHPSLGPLRAGDLLAAWAAHDHLHWRQLIQRRFQLTERDTDVYDTGYAGRWPDPT